MARTLDRNTVPNRRGRPSADAPAGRAAHVLHSPVRREVGPAGHRFGGAPPTCRARRRAARRRGRRWLDRAVDRVRGGSRRALPGTTRAHATVPRTDKGDARVRACRARGGEADIGAGAGG
ncbi:hypothetical protein OG458_31095 [Streptomyces sp. NBC_01281]|nr:hypothetical protein OG458_31095 [Streptomyces sp. NBC_01281]